MKLKTKYNLGQCVLFTDADGLNVGTIDSIYIKIDSIGCRKIEYTIATKTLNSFHCHNVNDVKECAITKILNKKEYEGEFTKQLAKLTAEKVAKDDEDAGN